MKIILILIIILIHGNNAMSENLNWSVNPDTLVKLNPAPTKYIFYSGENKFLEFDLKNKTIWLDPDLQPKEIAEKFLESMKYLDFSRRIEK